MRLVELFGTDRFARILSLKSVDHFGTSEHFSGRKKKRRILISKTSMVRLTVRVLYTFMSMRLFWAMIEIRRHVHHVFLSLAMM